ncbi:hypothetical protein [Janthinobacterium sp. BJB401]|uniref:hypothetical protein n=1 Tax=Janthinobacterium sp. BJB401 TaxID=2745934 RepID=UPI001595D7E7|nr:hypothetical protein [Janthinobacterium sp. BJB401]NVI83614.1 hypothetical protein [Janthinobacterium sp. BJB401]
MNDIAIADEDVPLAAGQIRFYCAAEPPLQAGSYWLQAQQTVDGLKADVKGNSFGVQTPFLVSGPRFQLPSQDLQLVYPPANMVGNYEESLPHVVLRTRTLPWVRSIDGNTNNAGDNDGTTPPWIGLLTLYPDELKGATPQVITVAQLIDPGDPSILGPTLIDADTLSADELASQLLAIDLDLAAFLALAPSLAELPLLAHVREVNTDQKEVLGMVEDGWFSVAVGNRLPRSGCDNSCFLVSLEGQQAHLHGGPAIAAQYKTIRLVCLATWKFTAAGPRGSFLDYMQNLCGQGGVDLMQPTHRPFPADLSGAEKTAVEALQIGYIPLQNVTRSGEVTTSWYRGPLSPVPTKADPLGPYFFSDRAIRYDPADGLFNMSYASAWQIGQLLGLSDAAFASSLFQWRINSYQAALSAVASDHLHGLADQFQQPRAGVTPVLLAVLSRVAGQAVSIAPLKAHERRDEDLLPGVVPDWEERIAAGEDALHLLHQHVRKPN